MLGGAGGMSFPNKSEEMWRAILLMPSDAQRVQPAIQNQPKLLKVIPAFLNLLHMGSLHFAVILWSEFFSHRLAQITLHSSITHQHRQVLAHWLFEPCTARKLAQELRCSEDSIFSSDFGKLVSLKPHLLQEQQVFPTSSLLSGQWP